MGVSLRNRSFNIRVSFDENGVPAIGFVHGFYDVSAECYDIRKVPDSVVLQIARKLGIDRSSQSLSITLKAKKAKQKEEKQQILSFENQQVTVDSVPSQLQG